MEQYLIQDENNMYTFKDGIKKVGKTFYYNPTKKPERGYATEEIAKDAVKKLMLHNNVGNLGHSFKVVEGVKDNTCYMIMESTTNTIIDENCFIKESETRWFFIGSTGHNDRRYISSYSQKKAEEVIKTLEALNINLNAGFKFYITEYKDVKYDGEVVFKAIENKGSKLLIN
ncbi:hypothetical protein [Pseudobacteroides cellulosolvens]|uniref:Uncharacterized protein n=1 Tax=Pseudobacteroides cellulosolvens ATCC 35603 = DSM 2933 TaxID=398512 RepID=A0A0L6JKG7_9FIRM|nr:hypothetical protein [Pseudobacteroides cellulosolvens]KNY26351.1 hypothetical protein Bccel_1613 [Pseudobacteroides cellulosolvens ATCC 35603 = DSM 2933]